MHMAIVCNFLAIWLGLMPEKQAAEIISIKKAIKLLRDRDSEIETC